MIVFMRHSPRPFSEVESRNYIHRFNHMISDTGIEHTPLRKMYFVQLDKALQQFLNGEDEEQDPEFQLLLAMMADINNEKVQDVQNAKARV